MPPPGVDSVPSVYYNRIQENNESKGKDMGYYSTVEGTLRSGDASINVDAVNDFVRKNCDDAGFWVEDVSPDEIRIYNSGKAYHFADDLRAIAKASGTHLEGEVIRYGEEDGDIERFVVSGDVVSASMGRIVFD